MFFAERARKMTAGDSKDDILKSMGQLDISNL
jgi:hypothetical protein